MRRSLARHGVRVAQGRTAYVTGWLLCVALVVQFMSKTAPALQWVTTCGILLCGATLMHQRPLLAVALLPITFLIGPITRVDIAGGVSLHLGDLYLGLVAILFPIKHGLARPLKTGYYKEILALLFCLILVSWIFSVDRLASTVAIVGIVQLAVAYIMTLNVIQARDDIDRLLIAWVAAVTLCSMLTISSYLRGETLLLNIREYIGENYASLVLSETVLYRASFFVTGFIFPLSCTVITLIIFLMYNAGNSFMWRCIFIAGLCINIIAVALLGSMTIVMALIVCAGMSMFWYMLSDRAMRKLPLFIALLSIIALIGGMLLQRLMSEGQIRLLFARFGDNESFVLRTYVWKNIVQFLIETPHALYLGLGPDVSIRMHDHPLLQKLFFGGGVQQEAVDNSYLYIVLNFGIFVLMLLLFVIGNTLARLTKILIRNPHPVVLVVWMSIVNVMVMGIAQQYSISKPALFIVQMVAIAELVLAYHRPMHERKLTQGEKAMHSGVLRGPVNIH